MSAQMLSINGHTQTSRLSLLDQGDIAEGAAGGVDSFLARHSIGDERFDLFFEVLLHLLGEIGGQSATRTNLL